MAKKPNNQDIPSYLRNRPAEASLAVVFLTVAVFFFIWGHHTSDIHGFLGYVLGILLLASAIKTFMMAYRNR